MASKVAIEVEIKNIKKISDLKKELKELRKAQRDYEKQVADGGKQSKKEAKGYVDTSKAIKDKSKNLRQLNKDMGSSTNASKKATKASGSMSKSFVKAAATIGIVVGAFRAVTRVLTSVVSTFTEFEFQMAKVKAISGATESEFKKLSDSAQALGRTTFFTAQQVAELQTNFAKLGFSTSEILAAQEATLLLATATGSDLARAAVVAGASVRGFGLHASETKRVVDVMTLAFNSSALDIEKWQTSMTKVAPIAAGMNIEIEDTAAIMGTLTDAGIEASIAGTSMRNIFLKMKDSSSDLSQFLGFTVRSSDDLSKALEKLSTASSDTLDGLVNIRQVAAFNVMVRGSERVKQLTEQLKLAEGAAKEAASIIGDTLQGSFLRLKSAAQGLSIELIENLGGGLQDFIDKVAFYINRLTENSEKIASVINNLVKVVKWLGLYKLGAIAATIATTRLSSAVGFLNGRLKVTRAMLVRTGVGALAVGLGYLAEKFLFTADATDDGTSAMDKYREEIEETSKAQERLNKALGEQLPTTLDDIQPALDRQQKYIDDIEEKRLAARNAFFRVYGHQTKKSLEKESKEYNALFQKRLKKLKEDNKQADELVLEFEQKKTRILKREGDIRQDILEKNFKDAKEAEDIRYRESISSDQQLYLNSEISKEEFNKRLLDKEILHLQNMKIILTKYSEDVSAIENKILNLRIKRQDRANKKEKAAAVTDNSVALEKIEIMKTVLSGARDLEEAERILRDLAIERAENELKNLPLGIFVGEEQERIAKRKIELENQIIDLKIKNQKETEKGIKSDAKALKKGIEAYSDLGSALTTFAGENEKLNGIRKAGEAITKAAAIAESILNLQKSIALVTEGKLTIAKLLGIKATIAGTAAIIADTIATVVSIIPKAISAVLSSMKGPFGLFTGIATLAFVSKVMKMKFENGGVVDDGNKFADGGMVHGPSHAQGGVKFAVGGRVNELEGGEAVINKRSTAMFRNQLSEMNAAGGGVKFADGGLLSSPQFTEAQFNANNQSQMLGAMGGQRKVVVVESDITDSQSTVSVIQANATF